MGIMRRIKKAIGGGGGGGGAQNDTAHLMQFAQSRQGVEAFIEPKTAVTEMTAVLVAADGEWTRRRIPNEEVIRRAGTRLGIPVYDVSATGYPERMREYTRKRKEAGETGEPIPDDPAR